MNEQIFALVVLHTIGFLTIKFLGLPSLFVYLSIDVSLVAVSALDRPVCKRKLQNVQRAPMCSPARKPLYVKHLKQLFQAVMMIMKKIILHSLKLKITFPDKADRIYWQL